MNLKWMIMGLLSVSGMASAATNAVPTPVIVSCAMRAGTTLMDITYRVNDLDDAVVSAWPLAFVDGTRSFAKVIRPTTFVEGTENNFGTNVLANTDYQLVWNVGADWDIDLGQLKFEIICKDSRDLLPFDWVSIPATETTASMTISKNIITSNQVLNAVFYQYALQDTGLSLGNGVLSGSATSGIYNGVELIAGTTNRAYITPYLFKQMNLQPALPSDVSFAIAARSGVTNSANTWYALHQPYIGMSNLVVAFGFNNISQCNIPVGLANVMAVSAGNTHSLALKSDGTVAAWGNGSGVLVPAGLSNVTAIQAGMNFNLALKSDGTLVAWGTGLGTSLPTGLSNVTAVATGMEHGLALKSDRTVTAWGGNTSGQCNVPVGLSNVTAVAAGMYYSLALKSDGKITVWGATSVPNGLSNVMAIAGGYYHSLAVKSNGTVVAWGQNTYGQCTVPTDLSAVTAVAAGYSHSLALKRDGTLVAWGYNNYGQCNSPAGLTNVTAIAAGFNHNLMIVTENK